MEYSPSEVTLLLKDSHELVYVSTNQDAQSSTASSRLGSSTTKSQRKIGYHLRGVADRVSKTCVPIAKSARILFEEAIEGQDIWSGCYESEERVNDGRLSTGEKGNRDLTLDLAFSTLARGC